MRTLSKTELRRGRERPPAPQPNSATISGAEEALLFGESQRTSNPPHPLKEEPVPSLPEADAKT